MNHTGNTPVEHKNDVDVADKVKNVIDIFGLRNAANTIVGNEMLRGVSGGEKKRVTLAEMMMGNQRVLLLGTCCL